MYNIGSKPTSEGPELESTAEMPDLGTTTEFWELLQTLPDSEPVPAAIINLGLLLHHLSPCSDTISVDREKIPVKETPEVVVPAATLSTIRRILLDTSGELTSAEKERVGKLCEETGLNHPPAQAATNADTTEKPNSQQFLQKLDCFEQQRDTESQATSKSVTHICPYCSQECSTKSELNSHKSDCEQNSDQKMPDSTADHGTTTDSQNDCPYCEKSYTSAGALRSHKRKRHRNEESDTKQQTDKKSTESKEATTKKYKCKHCKKKFNSKRKRSKHQNSCSEKSSNNPVSGGSVGKSVKKDNRGERVAGKNPFADTSRLKDTGLHQGGG